MLVLRLEIMLLLYFLVACHYDMAASGGPGAWTYDNNGALHWDGICAQGKSQSPVNIDHQSAVFEASLQRDSFVFSNYEAIANFKVVNNGKTVVLSLMDDDLTAVPEIKGGGLPNVFRFAQLHFHWGNTSDTGSEHTYNGNAYPLEVHLVHYNTK